MASDSHGLAERLCRDLQSSEERMGQMAGLCEEVRCVLDHEGVIQCLSGAWPSLTGLSRSEGVGRGLRELLVSEDRHILQAFLNSAITSVGVPQETSVRLAIAQGFNRWIKVVIQGMEEDGHRAFLVVLADVDEQVRLGETVRSQRDRGAVALEAAGRGLFELDLVSRELEVTGDLLGGEGEKPITLDGLLSAMHPEDREPFEAAQAAHIRDTSKPMSAEFRFGNDRKEWLWRMVTGQVVGLDMDGYPARMSGIITDISTRKQAEQKLKQSEQRLKSILADSPVGVAVVDQKGDIQFCNQRFSQMRNLPPDMLKGVNIGSFYTKHDKFCKHLAAFTRDQRLDQAKVAWGMQARSRRWVLMTWTPFAFKGRDSILCWAYDITELVRAERKLKELATTDHLCRIFNRRFFMLLAKRELNRAKRYNLPLSLVMFDADKFKAINDTHGHDVGDKVLVSIAATGKNALRDVDVLARIGGEEFAALLPETGGESAMVVAERLREAVDEQSIKVKDLAIGVTISLGVASLDQDVESVEQLLMRADKALYAAKTGGRNQTVYAHEMELTPQEEGGIG